MAGTLNITTLLSGATVNGSSGVVTPLNKSTSFAVFVVWGANTVSGVVEVECAPSLGYTGTWANLTTFTHTGTGGRADVWRGTGPLIQIRTRISTVVAGSNGVTTLLHEK